MSIWDTTKQVCEETEAYLQLDAMEERRKVSASESYMSKALVNSPPTPSS